MKFVKDGVIVIDDHENNANIWKRHGFEVVTEEEMSYTQLKTLAKEKGINTQGMKKEEILEALGM